MPRRPTVLLSALVAGVLAAGAAAPAAGAADFITGVSDDKRHGKVTLTFSTDPGFVRLTLSKQLTRTAAGKKFTIECRTDGRYARILSITVQGNNRRRLGGPAAVPEKADRCRVRRDTKIVAQMKMRRRA